MMRTRTVMASWFGFLASGAESYRTWDPNAAPPAGHFSAFALVLHIFSPSQLQ